MDKPVDYYLSNILASISKSMLKLSDPESTPKDIENTQIDIFRSYMELACAQPASEVMLFLNNALSLAYMAKTLADLQHDIEDISDMGQLTSLAQKYTGKEIDRSSPSYFTEVQSIAFANKQKFMDENIKGILSRAVEGNYQKDYYSSKELYYIIREYSKWAQEYLKIE